VKLGGSGEVLGGAGLLVMLPMKDNQNQIDFLHKGQQLMKLMEKVQEERKMSGSRTCFGRKKFQGRMEVRIGQLETACGQFGSALGRRRDQYP
jgi:hypothetical protein